MGVGVTSGHDVNDGAERVVGGDDDIQRLERVLYGTRLLHAAIEPLWDELPVPSSKRVLAIRGFSNIVRQHVTSQFLLVQHQQDVSATALVRPAYEALVRAIWTLRGADDAWIEAFFSPRDEAVNSDVETRKGPDVVAMLKVIERFHPAHIHGDLENLKGHTWRAMHSYVHGGIRPVVQSMSPFPFHEAGSVLINANGMLVYATNVVRMGHGLQSPMLPLLQQQYADCLPPATNSEVGGSNSGGRAG